jgi:hypothetical protein
MDVLARLRAAGLQAGLPLGERELARVQAGYPVPLPAELVRLAALTSVVDGLLDLDLSGDRHDVEPAELMPAGHPVAADGAGNFWLLDLTPDTVETAPVFFLGHDPAVLVYVAPDLATFIDRAVAGELPDDAPGRVWSTRPGALSYEQAMSRDDVALQQFAGALGNAWTFVDLRQREVGDGVAWGRYGPRTRLARHGWERIFGYAPYEKPPSRWRRAGFASLRRAGESS